jgi:hypothetical protein
MSSAADDRQISLEEVKTAAAARDLPTLVGRLARERSWGSLAVLFAYAGGAEGRGQVSLAELEAASRALADAMRGLPAPKNPRAALADELRAVRIAAGEALLVRSARPPLTELERRSLRQAALLLSDGGDHLRAANLCEELGDYARAADAWGALGDLDRMEAALAREEARDRIRRGAADAMRRFEVLMTGGERRLAVAAAAEIPTGAEEAATARQLAARIDSRLVRGRGVTLRPPGSPPVRLAALPALLGRDALVEVPLRDPGVSRRHARVRASDDGDGALVVEDAGSRGGVLVGGARLGGALPLRGEGEMSLGPTAVIGFRAAPGGRLVLRGQSGLDRQLLALVGAEPLPLELVVPGSDGLWLEFGGGVARLGRRSDRAVRVDGHFIGGGCDLLHGDVIELELEGGRLRLEVE